MDTKVEVWMGYSTGTEEYNIFYETVLPSVTYLPTFFISTNVYIKTKENVIKS